MRYLITFACYGVHLHGDESGSVDRCHSVPGSRLADASPARLAVKRQQMDQAPYYLFQNHRAAVLTRCARFAYIACGASGRRTCEPITFMQLSRRTFGPNWS